MDKYDFMSMINENFEGLQSDKEIEDRAKMMVDIIKAGEELAKEYLKAGIL